MYILELEYKVRFWLKLNERANFLELTWLTLTLAEDNLEYDNDWRCGQVSRSRVSLEKVSVIRYISANCAAYGVHLKLVISN